jgi:D-arginine dehydrogenase
MKVELAIIGAGMAGASLAAALDGKLSVLLLEQEDFAGYHATGRSAAFWNESYGGPIVQPLTTASGPWLHQPPISYGDRTFLRPRRALHVAHTTALADRDRFIHAFAASGIHFDYPDASACRALVPGIRDEWTNAIFEPSCCDIDVAALHQACLAKAKHDGTTLQLRQRVTALRRLADGWEITTPSHSFHAARIVNAAGAWASNIAALAGALPINISPKRRTMIQLELAAPAPEDMPIVIDLAGRFYFKPEANGRLWLSPHDETAMAPGDVAPDELDVAIAIDRLQHVTDWQVQRVERRWAGLRSFAPDRVPIYGCDPLAPGFFWFAGQGGFGIQTAPAAAALGAAMLLGEAPAAFASAIDVTPYRPDRFV